MEKLRERFDAVQEALLTLYENAAKDIDTQIQHWELLRQEHVIMYYARQNGIKRIGFHQVPSLATSEHKAKEAIRMTILLKSLKDSPFGSETWSLTETSLEIVNAAPSNCFKKEAYIVDVYYDRDADKVYPYTGWKHIYFQGEDNMWHKTPGRVDYYGLYYIDDYGDKVYYVNFDEKAQTLSVTGEWEVKYQNKTISPSVTSSSSPTAWKPAQGHTSHSPWNSETIEEVRRKQEGPKNTSVPSSEETPGLRHNRRRREGESGITRSPKRRRTDIPDSTGPAYPTPAQVGSSHRSASGHYSSRLERLQAEARDPPIIIVKGCANTLKCWRFRFKKQNRKLFEQASTVFKWVDYDSSSRMLLSFKDTAQRQLFLDTVTLPKGTQVALGSLNSL
ncbi:regulatory protein E2 [Human papillomavirus 121]|uniref:Regulatory protein E2 n=1 Tax=Human papillomavirus 121 TaxID=915429 RepID=D7P176_9PAPI|nr:regulatory protein E2 [Human papillomavirus 121]ADH29808.1 regulatory protein E2 [Human papillomavirus 121]